MNIIKRVFVSSSCWSEMERVSGYSAFWVVSVPESSKGSLMSRDDPI